jgi:hypothetical protein
MIDTINDGERDMATFDLKISLSMYDIDIGSLGPMSFQSSTSSFVRAVEPDGYFGEYNGDGLATAGVSYSSFSSGWVVFG